MTGWHFVAGLEGCFAMSLAAVLVTIHWEYVLIWYWHYYWRIKHARLRQALCVWRVRHARDRYRSMVRNAEGWGNAYAACGIYRNPYKGLAS